MFRHSIESSSDSFTYDWSIVTFIFFFFFFFFDNSIALSSMIKSTFHRQFDNFESMIKSTSHRQFDNSESMIKSASFLQTKALSFIRSASHFSLSFSFFSSFSFSSSMIILNSWSNQHLSFNRKFWASSDQLHHTTKNLVDRQ